MTTTPERKTPEQVADGALAASGFLDGQHRADVAAFIAREFRAAGLLVSDPADEQIKRAEEAYEAHSQMQIPIEDHEASCRECGWAFAWRERGGEYDQETWSRRRSDHAMRMALAAVGVAPQEQREASFSERRELAAGAWIGYRAVADGPEEMPAWFEAGFTLGMAAERSRAGVAPQEVKGSDHVLRGGSRDGVGPDERGDRASGQSGSGDRVCTPDMDALVESDRLTRVGVAPQDEYAPVDAGDSGWGTTYHRHGSNEIHRGIDPCDAPGRKRQVFVFDPDYLDAHDEGVGEQALAAVGIDPQEQSETEGEPGSDLTSLLKNEGAPRSGREKRWTIRPSRDGGHNLSWFDGQRTQGWWLNAEQVADLRDSLTAQTLLDPEKVRQILRSHQHDYCEECGDSYGCTCGWKHEGEYIFDHDGSETYESVSSHQSDVLYEAFEKGELT